MQQLQTSSTLWNAIAAHALLKLTQGDHSCCSWMEQSLWLSSPSGCHGGGQCCKGWCCFKQYCSTYMSGNLPPGCAQHGSFQGWLYLERSASSSALIGSLPPSNTMIGCTWCCSNSSTLPMQKAMCLQARPFFREKAPVGQSTDHDGTISTGYCYGDLGSVADLFVGVPSQSSRLQV